MVEGGLAVAFITGRVRMSSMGNAMVPGLSPLGGRKLVDTVDRACGAFGTGRNVAKQAICGSWV